MEQDKEKTKKKVKELMPLYNLDSIVEFLSQKGYSSDDIVEAYKELNMDELFEQQAESKGKFIIGPIAVITGFILLCSGYFAKLGLYLILFGICTLCYHIYRYVKNKKTLKSNN